MFIFSVVTTKKMSINKSNHFVYVHFFCSNYKKNEHKQNGCLCLLLWQQQSLELPVYDKTANIHCKFYADVTDIYSKFHTDITYGIDHMGGNPGRAKYSYVSKS